MGVLRRTLAVVFAASAVAVVTATTVAAQPSVSEHEVKAAFVYNFARFVDWPEESGSGRTDGFVIGVLGEDSLVSALEDVAAAGKKVRGRDLSLRRFSSASVLEPCQILFIGAAHDESLADVLSQLRHTAVLTVGETDGFLERGGMINLMLVDQKVRFEINSGAADRAGLKISSQLLKLAVRVLPMPAEQPGAE